MGLKPSVSLVTTCKGRLSYLKQTVPTWQKQNYYGKLEIIVVDYGCPDFTRRWCSDKGIRCISPSHNVDLFNISRARNIGICSSKSDIICCVDSHNLLSPIYVSTAVKALQAGYDLIHPDDIIGSASYPREMYHQLRGYDESLEGYGCEDCDFNDRAVLLGHKFGTIPGTLVNILPHTNFQKTEFYKEKDIWKQIRINQQQVADKSRPINPAGYGQV